MQTHVLGVSGGLRLELMEYGATVHRLVVPTSTGPRNVVLGHPSRADYVAGTSYFGATIGRYANRIADGNLEIDGTAYQLDVNENGNTLHGGPSGFDARDWTVETVTGTSATLSLVSPDGDQGFPGTLSASVTYTVSEDEVLIELSATTDAPTVVNLTNHSYFNLDGEGTGPVENHELTVHADRYTPAGERLLPTGDLAPVDGTPLDLRTPTRIGEAVRRAHPQLAAARGIDHNLVPRGDGLREVATVSTTDLELAVSSDAPGLQVYTGNFLDGTVPGTGGGLYRQGDGLALEPQVFPDTPNHPEFGTAVLRPGETYRRTIGWRFTASR